MQNIDVSLMGLQISYNILSYIEFNKRNCSEIKRIMDILAGLLNLWDITNPHIWPGQNRLLGKSTLHKIVQKILLKMVLKLFTVLENSAQSNSHHHSVNSAASGLVADGNTMLNAIST